jgi:hypothetical protein
MTLDCSGHCLCGAVRFAGKLEGDAVIACHCSQCRRSSGHFRASAHLLTAGLDLQGATLGWYESSPGVERGFCTRCGSFLFWRRAGAAYIAVSGGALDPGPRLRTAAHIFLADKGDCYATPADAPGRAQGPDKA